MLNLVVSNVLNLRSQLLRGSQILSRLMTDSAVIPRFFTKRINLFSWIKPLRYGDQRLIFGLLWYLTGANV